MESRLVRVRRVLASAATCDASSTIICYLFMFVFIAFLAENTTRRRKAGGRARNHAIA